MKIAVINAKGGTAKTTTSVNLSHGLANKKQRVLLVQPGTPKVQPLFRFGRDSLYPSIAMSLWMAAHSKGHTKKRELRVSTF